MTDKKKISILERLLDERDKQIQELKQQNEELEELVANYRSVDNDMKELKELIQAGYKMNAEYRKMNQEYTQMKKDFGRDMKRLFIRSKMGF